MGASNSFVKDPDDVLDYKWDFANTTNGGSVDDWLAAGETIATYTLTPESGITIDSDAKTDADTSITAWLSGGTDGEDYELACQIVTSASRTLNKRITVKVRSR